MPKFSQKIYKVGINPCVEVPRRVSDDIDKNGYVPVKGTINGHQFKSTLVPLSSWRHRLYINGEMRKTCKAGVGDEIEVVLEFDDQPQETPMPRAFSEALEADLKAKTRYESYTPSRQREILAYLNSLKKPEPLEQNITRLLIKLTTE